MVIFRSVIALLVLWLGLASPALAEMVSIKGPSVALRSGPGDKYNILWDLGDGFPLQVLKRKGNWLRVQDFENTVGWVRNDKISSTPHMIVKVNKGTKKHINVRASANDKSKIVAKACYGVVFETLEQRSGWVKVRHENGVVGWVSRQLLWGW